MFSRTPSQPIGKNFSDDLINSTHKTNKPEILKINTPIFIQDASNEHGIKASFKLTTSMKVMDPHNACPDHFPSSLKESHRKTIRT
jgi:hypothetical protein